MTLPEQDRLVVPVSDHADQGRAAEPRLPVLAYVGVIVGATVVLGYFARNVFLFWDDYLFLGEAVKGSWSFDHLADGLFQHFSPLTRAVNLAVVGVLPGNAWVIWLVLMVCAAGLVTSSTVLMVALFGRTWVALVGSALLGPTLSLLPLVNWWTAGVNILPALAGSTLCLAGVVFLVRGRSRWWGVAAVVAYLIAVLDWESAMLMTGYAALWLLLFRTRVTTESLAAVLRRTWWMWALLVVIGGASLVDYRLNYYLPAPPAGKLDILKGLWISLFDTMVPSLLGFHDPSTRWFSLLGTVLGGVAFASLVVFTLVRRSGAWRGWLFAFAGWFLPSAALVLNRVGYWGPIVAEQVFYFYFPTFLFLVGALEAWVAPRRKRRAGGPVPRARVRRVATVLTACAVGVAYLRSADATIATRIPHGADPNYVSTASASAAAIGGQQYSVINADVPEGLVPQAYAPYNRVSNVLGLTVPDISFDDAGGLYYVADVTGELRPVGITWETEVAARLSGDVPIEVQGATDVRFETGQGVCFTALDENSRVSMTLPSPVKGDHLVVRSLVDVDRTTDERLLVAAAPDGELGAANDDANYWSPREPGRLDTVLATEVSSLAYDRFTPGAAICLSSISVGSVGPRS